MNLNEMDGDRINELIEIVRGNRGSAHLSFHLRKEGEFDVEMSAGSYFNIAASDEVIARLQELVGEKNVKLLHNYR